MDSTFEYVMVAKGVYWLRIHQMPLFASVDARRKIDASLQQRRMDWICVGSLSKGRICDHSCVGSRRSYRCLGMDTPSLTRGIYKQIVSPCGPILGLFTGVSKVHVFQTARFYSGRFCPPESSII
jgi:hypothetical protein